MKQADPMFLPDVETDPQPSPACDLIPAMQQAAEEYPQIWHLFAYRPEATRYLGLFTQAIMRDDGPLSPGMRELIAAFTSSGHECPF